MGMVKREILRKHRQERRLFQQAAKAHNQVRSTLPNSDDNRCFRPSTGGVALTALGLSPVHHPFQSQVELFGMVAYSRCPPLLIRSAN